MKHNKVRFFRQHSLETCGISCILTALDAFGLVQYPTEKQEMKLYGIYRCRAFKGTLASAAADCLSKNGLEVGLYHSSPEYLDNLDGYFPEPLFRAILEEYTETLERIRGKVRIETGCSLTPDWYRSQLDGGRLLMVQCLVPGDADGMHDKTLHWILLYGYEGDDFLACDPLSRKIRLSEAELEGYANTPQGRLCVAVGAASDGAGGKGRIP